MKHGIASKCDACGPDWLKSFIVRLFPILDWLPKYSWKANLASDVISGATVAVMHIPQGEQPIQSSRKEKRTTNN